MRRARFQCNAELRFVRFRLTNGEAEVPGQQRGTAPIDGAKRATWCQESKPHNQFPFASRWFRCCIYSISAAPMLSGAAVGTLRSFFPHAVSLALSLASS
jgi:hypothetical protein